MNITKLAILWAILSGAAFSQESIYGPPAPQADQTDIAGIYQMVSYCRLPGDLLDTCSISASFSSEDEAYDVLSQTDCCGIKGGKSVTRNLRLLDVEK